MGNVTELKWDHAKSRILQLLKEGKYAPGQRLPSEQELANEFLMNHRTVRRGLDELAKEGLIDKRPRVGNFVKRVRQEELTQVVMAKPDYMMEGNPPHPAISVIMGGITRELGSTDYVVGSLTYRPDHFWSDVAQVAINRGVKGIILPSPSGILCEEVERLQDNGVKIVLLSWNTQLARMGLPCVDLATNIALAQVMRKLCELGHKNIVVARYTSMPLQDGHMDVLRLACKDYGLGAVRDILLEIDNMARLPDFSPLASIFSRKSRPTAVVVMDEGMASPLFRFCYEHNVNVPRDMSIVSLHDLTPNVHPVPLSAPDSVLLTRQSAEWAARYLKRLIHGEDLSECIVSLKCSMQWRASIGPAPTE